MSGASPDPATTPKVFATTHWSVVTAAGQDGSESGRKALETLCRGYWYPIYVYVVRKGHGPNEAQDLTQEFFAQLIEKQHLQQADQNRGKFRTFLLATLDHFLAREWRRDHRQKRGGGFTFTSLDEKNLEEQYRHEPADNDTPEKQFLRQWARAILKQTMDRLGRECEAEAKGALFLEVKNLLSGERDSDAYRAIAGRISMSEGAIRVAVHRLRQRYGELLRDEIAQTVEDPAEIEEELRYLLTALRPP
jgi:RNA polymerase sigma factor (sigma-70 family)